MTAEPEFHVSIPGYPITGEGGIEIVPGESGMKTIPRKGAVVDETHVLELEDYR